MFDKKKIKELILTSLIADSYSLGSHWVYDEKQLEIIDFDWNELNDAKSVWHKGKKAGDFTHYGDQTLWLFQYLQDKESFDKEQYLSFWKNKIDTYNGYIDSATRETLENIEKGVIPAGSSSTDLSIVGRIAPLLLVSKTKKEFLDNVEQFVSCTHNSDDALLASRFFATVLLEVLEGKAIEDAILGLKDEYNTKIQSYIFGGVASKTDDTFSAIRGFGPACDINGGFEGVIHLLCKYTSLKEMLINNAKAGGDTSARAMISSIIIMAQKNKSLSVIPPSWLNIKATII